MHSEKKDSETASQDNTPENVSTPADLPEFPEASQVLPQEKPIKSNYSPVSESNAPQVAGAPRSSGAKSLWAFMVFLFKLVIFLLVLAAISTGVYFGWPIVYNQYILPVQNNTTQVTILNSRQQASQEQLGVLQTQIPAIVTSQAKQDAALTAISPHMEALSSSIETHTRAIAELENKQANLQIGNNTIKAESNRQIELLKSMELLSRARLFLYQSNFGLAKQDVQAAHDLLAKLGDSSAEPSNKSLEEVVQRLDLTLSRLPEFPVAASDDLDIAWQILLLGKSMPIPSPSPMLTVENSTPTHTPTAMIETPPSTPNPTATP